MTAAGVFFAGRAAMSSRTARRSSGVAASDLVVHLMAELVQQLEAQAVGGRDDDK